MLLKIRYKKITTYEAVVDVPSGFDLGKTLALAEDAADEQDMWKPVSEQDLDIQIIEEDGKIPTVRSD